MKPRRGSAVRRLLARLATLVGAVGLTLAVFLVLPLFQAIGKPPPDDLEVRSVDTANIPPPPPPPEQEPEQEPEPEDKPPELAEEAPPLDLSQLELALNPGGMVGDWGTIDTAVRLDTVGADGGKVDALFSVADLDQKPRVIYQPGPVLNAELRKKAPGTAYIIFIVDENGRVESPVVQSSTDPVFERPALSAVKQWKFEPGKRNGQSVRFKMRVPITFPEG